MIVSINVSVLSHSSDNAKLTCSFVAIKVGASEGKGCFVLHSQYEMNRNGGTKCKRVLREPGTLKQGTHRCLETTNEISNS